MKFFTADTHFSHYNIIKYCNRPFSSIEEMNQTIIDRWNSKVKKGDVVYHLGDFLFKGRNSIGDILNVLNGQIILIKGNHDWKNMVKEYFPVAFDLKNIKIHNIPVTLCHYPMKRWPKMYHGAFHLFGHCHGTMEIPEHEFAMDVGVDCHNFYPLSENEIYEWMINKKQARKDFFGEK